MKLYVEADDTFCYPDVMVLCEAGRRHERYVEEPTLIVEVLSDSTEAYDRGLKFEHYRNVSALRNNFCSARNAPTRSCFTARTRSCGASGKHVGTEARSPWPSGTWPSRLERSTAMWTSSGRRWPTRVRSQRRKNERKIGVGAVSGGVSVVQPFNTAC